MRYLALISITAALVLSGCNKEESTEPDSPIPTQEAARFLQQATFGPSQADIDSLAKTGFSKWFNNQFVANHPLHVVYMNNRLAALQASDPTLKFNFGLFQESFWRNAATGSDTLRQRVAFALSQIFVVSVNGDTGGYTRGVASYYDMLEQNAFGNYRTLLEQVSLHPMMGIYLTHIHNQKANGANEIGPRMPDENYAREIMQLFSIGLYQLNMDGSVKLDSNNHAIETYTNEDITGLAKVFTGWSWACTGGSTSSSCFWGSDQTLATRDITPMQIYPAYHSATTKTFLGTTISPVTTATADSARNDLKIALDLLFKHPNTAPFISKQLIQHLVTSNPSPEYVQRISNVFANNGNGVRGDLKAVVAAILMDEEARSPTAMTNSQRGRLRDPVARLAHWMRATQATSSSGNFTINDLSSSVNSFGQSPMRAPSVFNFYRPGYTPPGTSIASQNLVAPGFQIANEVSVAGYVNALNGAISNYMDVKANYPAYRSIANDASALVDYFNLVLTGNTMTSTTLNKIKTAVGSITIRTSSDTNTKADQDNRVKLTVLLIMASPEYLIQK